MCLIARAAPLSASDESPRASAAIGRENAVRCRLASNASTESLGPGVASPLMPTNHSVTVAVCVLARRQG